jgi:hypothetical protein
MAYVQSGRCAPSRRVSQWALGLLLIAPTVRAESPRGIDQPVETTNHTSELAFGAGNHLGLGSFGGAPVRLQDLSGGGTTLEIGLGYRLKPAWVLGVYATGSRFAGQDVDRLETSVLTSSAGVQLTWHTRPDMFVDPWLGLGTGWRGMWLDGEAGRGTSHGLDLARVQAGLDFRILSSFALAPVIGADWLVELWSDPPVRGRTGVNAFLFAGALARLQVRAP